MPFIVHIFDILKILLHIPYHVKIHICGSVRMGKPIPECRGRHGLELWNLCLRFRFSCGIDYLPCAHTI